jgi:hypothetical protein
MFNRRRIALVVAGACLLVASGAAAAPEDNKFTASSTPSLVQPAPASPVYTITLTNDPAPSGEADRGKIIPPAGFAVIGQPGDPTVSGCAGPPDWGAEVLLDGTISLARIDGSQNNLCPGGILTVVFSATAAVGDKTDQWGVELRQGDADPPFTLREAHLTVEVDGTAPTVTITGKPNNPSNSTSASFAFIVSEANTVECKLDGGAFAPCASTTSYSSLGDGPHTFTVQATDAAGNTAESSYAWTIETRAPTASVTSGPAALSTSRSATFAFSADEPSSFECQLDGGSFQGCGSPASYQGLGDGTHTFAVQPTDAAGNTGATSSHGWKIDGTAPETTLGSGPRSGTTALSATFTFSASEPAAFECKLDSAAFAPCTSPKSHASLARREHTFEVRAIDAAGNPDPTPAIHRWTIAAAPRRAATTSALLAPRAGARVTSPPLLVWRRAARASYYNVQLYRGRVKVLSSWPVRTRLQLRARWTYLGRQRQLAPGAYRWYVWPGYGRPSARRYGRLLGQSTFTVTPRR